MAIYTTKSFGLPDQVNLKTSSLGKDDLIITPPPEFKGPEDSWSPEDLFSATLTSCYILTFKALARFKKMDWVNLEVTVDAHLEKTNSGHQFTKATISPKLTVCCKSNIDPYLKLLKQAEENCLISKSIKTELTLKPKVILQAVQR